MTMTKDHRRRELICSRIEPELRASLEHAAEIEQRSVSNLIRLVLIEYLAATSNNRGARAA